MYRNKKIALVIPAYREEKLIEPTLNDIPDLIDMIYVIDDNSPDNQNLIIEKCAETDSRVKLIRHTKNTGPGGAIITGYLQSSIDNNDITVVVGGDFQMPMKEVSNLLDPIIDEKADYTKGNRFSPNKIKDTINKMPRKRVYGNWIITALTKLASGHYKIMDVVDGYTAITKTAIDTIDWNKAWKKYGYPMDFLIRINAYGFKVLDVPRTAIYLPNERQSQIKGLNYTLKVSPMLLRDFLWRLHFKYIYLDFQPLVIFYYLSFILIPLGIMFGIYLLIDKLFLGGFEITASRTILDALLLTSGIQFFLFAMWMDIQNNERLYKS